MNQKQLKAKQLRYKKPMLKELNLESIKEHLYEMMEMCSDIQYYYDDNETLLHVLEGDEDEAHEFKMMFSDLAYECNRMFDDLRDVYITEHFDDFCVAICKDNGGGMLGWDSYEQDYMGIEWEEFAISESGKRIARLKKDEIIDNCAFVFKVLFSYLSLQSRYNDLKAAYDILNEKNLNLLKTVDKINEVYDKANDHDFFGITVIELERLASEMPQETWLY